MKIYSIPVIFMLLFSFGCDKTKPVIVQDKIYFFGISKTYIDGSPLSAADTTDWTTGDNWSNTESGLFPNSGTNICQPALSYSVIAYPNPCQSIFNIFVNHADSSMMSFRIVDQDFNVLLSKDSITSQNIMLNLSTFGVHDTVRIYYKFFEGSCEFRGHGDVIIM